MNDRNSDLHDKRLSHVYQQSRIEEPPMALDSVILTQARKAVEKPAKRSIWRSLGWRTPLASVAVAMLTVSLFIQMKQEHPESMAPVMMDAAPIQQQGTMAEEDEEALTSVETLAKEVVEKKAATKRVVRQESVPPTRASKEVSRLPHAKQKFEMQRRTAAVQQLKSEPAAIQAGSVESDMMYAEPATVAAREARPAKMIELSIDNWLKQIRDLIRDGKTDDARVSLKKFRKAHPDYSLPKDIVSALE